MTSFFQMTHADEVNYSPYGVAYSPEDIELVLLPPNGIPIANWPSCRMELRGGGYADYLANDMGVRLCSQTMRLLVDQVASTADGLQWLEVAVEKEGPKSRPYFVMHFSRDFPIVDRSRSIIAAGMVVKPVLSAELVRGHDVLAIPGEYGRVVFVSDRLRMLLQRHRISGVAFHRVPMAC